MAGSWIALTHHRGAIWHVQTAQIACFGQILTADGETPETTMVCFIGDQYITVRETPDQILNLLLEVW